MLSYVAFNQIEGVLWIFLGLVALVLYRVIPREYKKLSIFSAGVLIMFGLSDFAEVRFGSFFEPGMWWLFVWKILGVVGLATTAIWYLALGVKK